VQPRTPSVLTPHDGLIDIPRLAPVERARSVSVLQTAGDDPGRAGDRLRDAVAPARWARRGHPCSSPV